MSEREYRQACDDVCMTERVVAEVVWGDAWIETNDISVKKAQSLKPVIRRTVGYLIADNDEGLVLSTDSYDKEPQTVNSPMFIPHGMVIEYWVYV